MPPHTNLSDTVVVITGAGRGIGRAAALATAAAGASIVVNDADEAVAESCVDEIKENGGLAVAYSARIGTVDAAEGCVQTAVESFGKMDVFCANAGILRDNVLWKTAAEDFDAVIATHLRGTFTCGQAAARYFRKQGNGGAIVLLSSVAGMRGNFGQTAYSAAKAGIAALARTWSMELQRDRIAVNAIVPTALTRMVATIPGLAEHVEAAELGDPIPRRLREELGLGRAEDVAPLFVFLASPEGRDITGQCIGIGGDRLSIWSHPVETAVALREGGWTPETIAEEWRHRLSDSRQSVGIDSKT